MKTGILGGTFDPVHRAHLKLAKGVQAAMGLDRVLFMIAHVPPHKIRRAVSSAFHRYAMVALALQKEDFLQASAWELGQQGPSYTIETMRAFTQSHPQDSFCFMAGSDSLKEIHLWREYDKLMSDFCLVFVQRPGSEVNLKELKLPDFLKNRIDHVSGSARPDIRPGSSYLISIDVPDISSTSIRRRVAAGESPAQLLPPGILHYIRKHRLYGQKEHSEESLSGH